MADAALNRRHLACSHFHPAECYSKDFCIRSHIEGVKFFPGLPNGTEVGQECDQRLEAFKAFCYQNQKPPQCSYQTWCRQCRRLTHNDIGYLFFGGVCILEDGTEVELEEAFSLYFLSEHIHAPEKNVATAQQQEMAC